MSRAHLLLRRLNVVLYVTPDDIFSALRHTRALVQQRPVGLSVWEQSNGPHHRPDWISVQHALTDTRDEERRLASFELVVQIKQEGIHGALLLVLRRRVVHIRVILPNAGRRPSSVNMASVFCAGNVSVYTEAPIQATGSPTVDYLWDVRGDSRPQQVMEGNVDNPVEVVGEDAHVSVAAEGCVGKEIDGLTGSNDRLALGGREDVCGHAEAGHGGMGVIGCGRAGSSQRNGVRGSRV